MNDHAPSAQKQIKVALLGTALCCLPFWKAGCHGALIAYLLLWAFEGKWNAKFAVVRDNTFAKLLVILSIVVLVGLLYTEDWNSEKFPLAKKAFLILLPVAIVTSRDELSKHDIRSILMAFTAVCTALIFVALIGSIFRYIQFLDGDVSVLPPNTLTKELENNGQFWTFVTYTNLAKVVHLHPTYFSLYLGTCILFLLNELTENGRSAFKIFLIIIFCASIILLSSRIVMIATGLLLLVASLFSIQRSPRFALTIAILLICSIALAAFNPVSRYRGWDEIRSTPLLIKPAKLYINSTEIRASLWYLGWAAFRETNPFFGAGTGDVSKEMKFQRDVSNITNVLDNYDPHSQYLHVMIGHGIIGLISMISILVIALLRGVQDRNLLLAGFMILISVVCITESMLEVQKGIVLFSILVPMLMRMNRGEVKTQTQIVA